MPILSQSRPVISGTVFCVVSALAYTMVNICMRQLTALQCDPLWAVFNRELVTTLALVPWLLCQIAGGRAIWPSGRTLRRIVVVGLIIQVVGNLCVQWALGVVGLAITIPAVFGASITAGAVMGRIWLGERVSPRSATSIGLLLAALVLLGMGAEAVGRSMADAESPSSGPLMLTLGVAAGGLAGSVFAMMNITIRHSVTRTTLPTTVALLVPLMGVVSLGPLSAWRLGMKPLLNTPWEQIALMVAAGVFNLVGFLALIHGLKRTTVIHVNSLSASQVAMAALAGIVLFHEPPNPWILFGIVLTIAGILRFDRPADGGGV